MVVCQVILTKILKFFYAKLECYAYENAFILKRKFQTLKKKNSCGTLYHNCGIINFFMGLRFPLFK